MNNAGAHDAASAVTLVGAVPVINVNVAKGGGYPPWMVKVLGGVAALLLIIVGVWGFSGRNNAGVPSAAPVVPAAAAAPVAAVVPSVTATSVATAPITAAPAAVTVPSVSTAPAVVTVPSATSTPNVVPNPAPPVAVAANTNSHSAETPDPIAAPPAAIKSEGATTETVQEIEVSGTRGAPSPDFSSELIARADESRRILGSPLYGMEPWLKGLSAEGWYPVNLTVQSGAAEPWFSCVAIKLGRRDFKFVLDSDANSPAKSEGVQPYSAAVYAHGGQLRAARLLTPEAGYYATWSGSMAAVLQRLSKAETHAALRPVSLNVVSGATGAPRLFVQLSGSTVDWKVQPGLSLTALKELEVTVRQAGRRIEVLNSYSVNGETQFIIEDVENKAGLEWKLLLEQSRSDFEHSVGTEAPQSFRPWCVAGYGADEKQARYASIWIKAVR